MSAAVRKKVGRSENVSSCDLEVFSDTAKLGDGFLTITVINQLVQVEQDSP